MMKRFILIGFIGMLVANNAVADCSKTTITYSSCKPGYYYLGSVLSTTGGDCFECPDINGTAVTSPDKNTEFITSCYAPAGTTYTDTTGTFQFTSDCYYSGKL